MTKTSMGAVEYFDEEFIALGTNEIFIDGGCFDGATAIEFLEKFKGHVYSFEPDKENFAVSEKNLKSYTNVELVPKGLWSSETTLSFFINTTNMAGSSFVAGEGTAFVPVISLDHFFSDKPDEKWPTFIKLDIEGAEREALIGAKDIIKQKKPKLTICAYHKAEDIYELPQLIHELVPFYQMSLRQYSDDAWDTILYAVPKSN